MKGDDFMGLFKKMEEADYEQVVFLQDKATGLKGVTVIHDTTLGPALGGTRYWTYDKEEDALEDALRLAKGMTYKNAAAGLPLGGGKTVILKEPDKPVNKEALFRVFGRFVEGLNGRYVTAPDVGTNPNLMDHIYQETDYVVSTNLKPGTSGNPSPATAYGVYVGTKAAAKRAYGSDSLQGKTVLLEGVGSVGLNLAKKFLNEGAKVVASDINEARLAEAKDLGCQTVPSDQLLEQKGDIYSPCALGATVNADSIEKLVISGIKVVAGSANNQLANDKDGDKLEEKGIVYTPDYILNAGGAIQVSDEFNGGYDRDRNFKQVENIYNQIESVFDLADRDKIPTYQAADRFAEERIQAIAKTKSIFKQKDKSALSPKIN